MSETFADDTFNEDAEQQQETPKALREAANRSGKYKAEAETLRRENAFLKAGISVEDTRLSYFVKGYDGDLDPKAIRQAAIEAGFLQQQGQSNQQTQQTAEAQQRVMRASAGAVQEGTTESGAIAALEAAMAEGGVPAMLDVARQFGIPVIN